MQLLETDAEEGTVYLNPHQIVSILVKLDGTARMVLATGDACSMNEVQAKRIIHALKSEVTS